MGGFRAERIAELVHRELATRLVRDVKDSRLEPVSITHVEVTRDLSRATVHYLPLGGGEPSDDLVAALDSAARQLRGPIGRALQTRHAPELVFQVDRHTENAIRMTQLLEEIGRELNPPAAPEAEIEDETGSEDEA